MSTYKVPLTKILEIKPHNNADRLEICVVYGFEVISAKGTYQVGDVALYVPVDSILPQDVEDVLFPPDSKIKLDKHRIRQIKIRGMASQGMLIKPDLFADKLGMLELETDYAEKLGITKYEPPIKEFVGGTQKQGTPNPKNHPLFTKYGGLDNIKWYPSMFQEGEEVIVDEKIHGCMQYNTEITLFDGTKKKIGEIVNQQLDVEVLGVDADGNTVPAKINHFFNNGKSDDWYKVKVSAKGTGSKARERVITCTGNHKFFIPSIKEYKACEELQLGEDVVVARFKPEFSFQQEQVLIGKYLGDGSWNKDTRTLMLSHKKEHEQYLDYTLKCLGSLAGNKQSEQESGYGTTMCKARVKSSYGLEVLFNFISCEGQKRKILHENFDLSVIALAFWYMDDGSLSHSELQEDRACLALNSYDEESVDILCEKLKNLGLEPTLYESNGWRIRFNKQESDKFFILIAPYIPEIMQYKLPAKYRGHYVEGFSVETGNKDCILTIQKIISVEKVDLQVSKVRYDIETSTHNYFANGVLVHNSHIRAGWMPMRVNTLWKKVKKFFGFLPEWEWVYGSNNVQLQAKNAHKGFYGDDIYGKVLDKYKVQEWLPKGFVIHGEIYGSGIQNNYTYGCKDGEHKLCIFDMKQYKKVSGVEFYEYLTREKMRKELHFSLPLNYEEEDFLPPSIKMAFNKDEIYKMTFGSSILCPEQPVREGLVIRSVDYSQGRRILKWISEEYLDDKSNTDFH